VGNNSNLLVGTGAAGADGLGLAWFADFGATAPTDAGTALNAAFKDTGLIAEEGLSLSLSETVKKIKAYGSLLTQRSVVTDQDTTFKLKFLESNQYSLAVYHRKAISGGISPGVGTGAFSVTTGSFTSRQFAMVAEIVDGTAKIRAYAPKVEVTNRDDLQIGNGNEISYGVELTAYQVSGVAIYWYYVVPSLG
jgi:hypothetical protein